MKRGGDSFQTVKTEGSILPYDLLRRLIDGDSDIPGLKSEDYHLAKSERLNEVATRGWNRLQGAWEGFREAMEKLPDTDVGTSLTREKWLLILFQELGYGRLTTRKAADLNGKTYPISHEWQNTPIHLVSFRQELDKRTPGRAGAARVSPHSLVQEFLNRSDDHLWGFVSNGLNLRLLRDNATLTRQAYVEFDLQAMMDSEAYSDFFLLFLICHQSRVEIPEGKGPSHCWLEKWYNTAGQQGVRALDLLRNGVQQAIESLGGGFLAFPANNNLREKVMLGELSTQEYYRQVLRQVYRLLFLFVAEDRELLLDPSSTAETRKLYTEHYSTRRIRKLAGKTRGTRHPDIWRGLALVLSKLHDGCPTLGIPAFGSFLFSEKATEALNGQDIANSDLLRAIRALAYTIDRNVLHPVNYRNLGPEELGSVYESLLEMHPEVHIKATNPADRFRLTVAAGSERKTTGSYYTPTSLVNCLLDSALDPVIDEAIKKPDAEKALLSLKVCDPACGSGHFLIAAAHRIAKRLASLRAGEEEPSPIHYQHALRDVIGNCIYGVDINPMSVELCKVSLWLEAIEPGRPLSFLDHRIKCGNSLLGATPALLTKGIPDEAFNPIEGDDKAYCSEFKRQNKKERESLQSELFTRDAMPWERLGNLPTALVQLDSINDATLEGIEEKEKRYTEYVESAGYRNCRLWADAWCAAFVWIKRPEKESKFPYPITEEVFRRIERNPFSIDPKIRDEIVRQAKQFQFFHWHIEFPDVFHIPGTHDQTENTTSGWSGGFDCVLGNPPWERIKLQEEEFFAERSPSIANAQNAAARRKMIADLEKTNKALYGAFKDALRLADGESHLVRDTGRYPLCGRGDVNTYSIFSELKRELLNCLGRVGCIVPSGIATDDTTKYFFRDLMKSHSLESLYIFENEGKLFPGIDHRNKFCLLTVSGGQIDSPKGDFVFGVNGVTELDDVERHFELTSDDVSLINPNTRTCPIFRHKRDAELTKYVYRNVPILLEEATDDQPEKNPWGISFLRMIDMANDSGLFRTREQLEIAGYRLSGNVYGQGEKRYLPLYEGKMFWHFDHRFGTYQGQTQAQANQKKLPELNPEQHRDPDFLSLPRYWVAEDEVKARIPKYPEILALAMKVEDEWRDEAVNKVLSYWAASYWRVAGNEAKAKVLLARYRRPTPGDSNLSDLYTWLDIDKCEWLQERYPLRESDVDFIASCQSDPMPIAEELLERFSPHWFVAFRDVTNSVVVRTSVFSIIPRVAVGHKAPLVFSSQKPIETLPMVSILNSFVFDYIARQSLGGSSMGYFILKQLPVIKPDMLSKATPWAADTTLGKWLFGRVLELCQTAWDVVSISEDCGCVMPPFVWDEDRRFLIRAELDAAFFHLYLGGRQQWTEEGSQALVDYFPSPRHAVEYIMGTFRILKERDEATYGSFKTKDTILEAYDAMAEAIRSGKPYQTRLDPPPGPPLNADGTFAKLPDWPAGTPKPNNWPPHIHEPRRD